MLTEAISACFNVLLQYLAEVSDRRYETPQEEIVGHRTDNWTRDQ